MAQGKAVAAKEEGKLPATDYGEYAGYMDEATSEELLIPFLKILQPMTPEVVDNEIEGAQAGMFYNTVTGQLYKSGELVVQAVHFDRMFVEWIPRDAGGGINGRYQPEDPVVAAARAKNNNSVVNMKLDGNDLLETVYVYVNILDKDGKEVEGFALMPTKSTHLKAISGWRTSMRMIKGLRPPVISWRAVLSTEKKKNEDGTWFQLRAKPLAATWKESIIPPEDRDLLDAGKAFFDMVMSGQAKADFDREAEVSQSGTGAEDAPF